MSDWEDDFGVDEEIPCPACGHATHWRRCEHCDDGVREYNDAPDEWGEDCPSEVNHLIPCRYCDATGVERWCPKCGADYWRAKRAAKRRAGGAA